MRYGWNGSLISAFHQPLDDAARAIGTGIAPVDMSPALQIEHKQ
jgi:hypothetical protein